MKNVKDKMYNYEVSPPSQSWEIIANALDEMNNYDKKSRENRNKKFYFSIAAAAITILFFNVVIRFINSEAKPGRTTAAQLTQTRQFAPENKITVPQGNETEDSATDLKNFANSPTGRPGLKKYLTITGPQGQPVKISSKVVSLIVSSDDRNPPNPVWNDKVTRWKNLMNTNILGPSTGDFLDVVDLTRALDDR